MRGLRKCRASSTGSTWSTTLHGLCNVWTNLGLPQYLAKDRKHEKGRKLQKLAYRRSGVMHTLRLVKTTEEQVPQAEEDAYGLTHSTDVSKKLGCPMFSSDRIVVVDPYFARWHLARDCAFPVSDLPEQSRRLRRLSKWKISTT